MRFVSLFAGVGGFDLGLTRSGHTCVGQVEIDKHARSILEKQFPEVPKHDNVTTAKEWADEIGLTGNIDLVAGGFPCQDLSVAGRRAGLAGERSGLFFDALAFATHTKAKTILLENVPGLLSSNQGRDFGVLLTHLADAGFSNIQWRVLDSQFFGVPQRRRRVFIVASLGAEPFKQVLFERESSFGDSSSSQQEGQDIAGTAATSARGSRVPGSEHVGALMASDYKFPQQQQVMENKIVVQQLYSQTSFGGYTAGGGTLTATGYKRPEDNVVIGSQATETQS